MSTLSTADLEIISDFANQATEYIFGKDFSFTPTGWDISGGTIAISEEIGKSLKLLFGSWSNVNEYKALQYERATKLIDLAEVQISKLSSGASAETAAIRRAAQVSAEGMREMGDLPAKGIPLDGVSNPANIARTAQYFAAFAKVAGTAVASG